MAIPRGADRERVKDYPALLFGTGGILRAGFFSGNHCWQHDMSSGNIDREIRGSAVYSGIAKSNIRMLLSWVSPNIYNDSRIINQRFAEPSGYPA